MFKYIIVIMMVMLSGCKSPEGDWTVEKTFSLDQAEEAQLFEETMSEDCNEKINILSFWTDKNVTIVISCESEKDLNLNDEIN